MQTISDNALRAAHPISLPSLCGSPVPASRVARGRGTPQAPGSGCDWKNSHMIAAAGRPPMAGGHSCPPPAIR